jgi:uridine phosphorylase
MGPMIHPQQVIYAAREAGQKEDDLQLSGVAVLTFSGAVMDRLEELCRLSDAAWLGARVHPYGGTEIVKRGSYRGLDVTAIVPMMGASPLSCVLEDLAACGIKAVFLACAAWSLGEPVMFGDLIVPSFSVGPDGTSIHYGNTTQRAEADPAVVEALVAAAQDHEATVHVGGNATCEALYRISREMVERFRSDGCMCMENGEANTLFSVCKALGITGGVIFQPYIDLFEGWDPSRLDETYRSTCRVQAEAVVNASVRLRDAGLL